MKLSSAEILLVKDLQNNPAWGSLLNKLAGHKDVPVYRPGSDRTPEDQMHHWVYRSGFASGVLFALTQLGYRNDDRE